MSDDAMTEEAKAEAARVEAANEAARVEAARVEAAQAEAEKEVTLSEDKVQLSEALDRIKELEAKDRSRKIDDKIETWSKTWGSHPVLIKTVKDLMMADDGGPALMLSEEGVDKALSATDVIDRIMEVLPKPPVDLSEQARLTTGKFGNAPENEDEASVDDRALATAQWLGDKTYLKTRKGEE